MFRMQRRRCPSRGPCRLATVRPSLRLLLRRPLPQRVLKNTVNAPLAIDLFCGLGGWTDGLLAEGYYVVGFDIEKHHYGDAKYPAQMVIQDVMTLHGRQFKDAALIVASPPCQEFSYMAMPWTLAKEKQARILADPAEQKRLTALFDACFRIQREACEAAGRYIPMVVENVKGAQKWVGRARWNFGSFYLWGDVPALMPIVRRQVKVEGFRFDGSGRSFQTAAVEGTKNAGGSWFNIGSPGQKETGRNPTHNFKVSDDGVKGFTPAGQPLGKNELGRKFGSKSKARKAASAAIAKIPFALAQYIARAWKPQPEAA